MDKRQSIWKRLRPFRIRIAVSYLATILSAFLSALTVFLVGPIMELLTGLADGMAAPVPLSSLLNERLLALLSFADLPELLPRSELLNFVLFVLLAGAFVNSVLVFSLQFFWEAVAERVMFVWRQELVGQFLRIAPTKLRSGAVAKEKDELAGLMGADSVFIKDRIVHLYGGMPRMVLRLVFLIPTLWFIAPSLTAYLFLIVVPGVALSRYVGKRVQKRMQSALKEYSDTGEWLQQRLLGAETIKHYRTEQLEHQGFVKVTQALRNRFLRSLLVKNRLAPSLEFITIAFFAWILAIAIGRVHAGQLHAGMALSFFATLGVIGQAANTLARYLNKNREGRAAEQRIADYSRVCRQSDGGLELNFGELPGEVVCSLRSVTLSFPDQKPLLRDQSFDFKFGHFYCVTGPSGCGKSSLMACLLGMMRPERGEVVWNASLTHASLGYIPQHALLAPTSLSANIVYPSSEMNPSRFAKARAAAACEFVDARAKSTTLSGGQGQRLLWARVFYHSYPVVLIDEGTSGLDEALEERLLGELVSRIRRERLTVIMVAHRKGPLKYADSVLRFENGRFVEV